jgi:glutathione peroxidase
MFSKIDVNGADTHPVYKFLKSQKGGTLGDDIKWNFTKFLIDKEGNVVNRFAPNSKPESLTEDIEKLL